MLFGWFRRQKAQVNHDVLTRLDCRELAELQHDIRHAAIGLQIEHRKAKKALVEAGRALLKMNEYLKRIESALTKEGNQDG
jgi:excinuclease UvrABC nuclease subunit